MEELIRKEELPKQIQVMESEGVKTVLLRGQHYMSWSDEDQISVVSHQILDWHPR